NIVVADFSSGDSFETFVINALAAAGDDPVNVCGLSMGGMIAGELAAIAPQRVKRLALLDTTLLPEVAKRTQARQRRIERASRDGLAVVALEELVPSYLAKGNVEREDLRKVLVDMTVDLGEDVFACQSKAISQRADRREALRSLACPVLVLCGDEDALFSVESHRDIAAIFGDSELVVIPQTGHIATLEAPGAVNSAMAAWLKQPTA
ncbi:MAG: alpha/beta fold hydrolase, partial [Rhizobiales bacterium]|nr:alpha/beta fold hydrolase [Hyphomicrobiales bacterium]